MQVDRSCSEHLIVHSGVAYCGCWGGCGAVGGHGIVSTLSAREVVGHLRVELFDSLLLLTLAAAATTTATTATSTLTASLSGSGSSLVGRRRLGLVLLGLSDTVSNGPGRHGEAELT